MTLSAGTQIGPYRILDPLGAGGMGEVYRAHDSRLNRFVAVKVLPEQAQCDARALARFEREARAVAALSHPNILAIHDVGNENGRAFVVTELLEGETLRERLRGRPLPVAEVNAIAGEVLEGLAAAHVKGIIHRDLKPENIFLTDGGHVKLLDFGLASVPERPPGPDEPTGEAFLTSAGTVLGTLSYMPPEQLRGEPVDRRGDVFSVGCVLFEMLTGEGPFHAATAIETATRILNDAPDFSRVPAAFRPAVSGCLEKTAARRLQSVDDVRAMLRGATGQPPAATTPTRGVHRRMLLGTVAALLIVVVAGALMLLRRSGDTGRAPIDSIAVLPLENLSGDQAQEYFADGMTELLTAELAQTHALKVISRASVMQYKGARKPTPQIARELGVHGIIEGSVLRVGNRVRITAQLIDGPNGFTLWAQHYERDVADVLSLQGEIARAIVREVSAVLTPTELTRLQAKRLEVSPAAFELYLKGRFEWNKRTREALGQAADLFTKAAGIDASYAPAWAGLADAYSMLANSGFVPPASVLGKARHAAQKALELDPQSAEAHAALGFILYQFDREWERAGEELRRAMELNPNYANGCQWYGAWLYLTNRQHEGLRVLQKAVDLDPLAPRIRTVYGYYLFFSGHYDESRSEFERTATDDADVSEMFLSDLAVRNGDLSAAMEHARLCCSTSPLRREAQIAYVTAVAGDPQKARRILSQAEKEAQTLLSPQALIKAHVSAGDLDGAFRIVFQDPAAVFVPYILGHPALDRFRRDPRYREFLRVVKLDAYY